jgi:CrcB protein
MFLAVGFWGGFSTFAAFTYDTVMLMQQNNWMMAITNMAANLFLCLCTFLLGSYLLVLVKN